MGAMELLTNCLMNNKITLISTSREVEEVSRLEEGIGAQQERTESRILDQGWGDQLSRVEVDRQIYRELDKKMI